MTVATHRQKIPCPFTALVFLFISVFVTLCESHDVYFLYYFYSIHVFIFSLFVLNSYGSSRIVVFYIHFSLILGVQDYYFLLSFFHMLLTNEINFPCSNTLKLIGSWYKTIKMFLYCATGIQYVILCFPCNVLNGFDYSLQ